MNRPGLVGWRVVFGSALVAGAVAVTLPWTVSAQSAPAAGDVTYTKDVAPILQRSCENCHRTNGAGPMALSTYEQVRPWARAIKTRTGIGPHAGVMPPWYVEKNIGIQEFQNDPSLSDEEVALLAKWADAGAPRGNPADAPPPKVYADGKSWTIGTPDLVVTLPELTVKGDSPDWWGDIAPTATGLTEDRYVAALEIKEVNDVDTAGGGRQTVGGRSAGLPRGAPLSDHFAISVISSSLSDGSFWNRWMPMFFSTYHGGMTPARGPMPVRCLMARAHGRTSS